MDITVAQGDTITLPCKISRNARDCQWTRGGQVVYDYQDSMYRYKGDKDSGDCSLSIMQIRREDENLWSCQLPTSMGTITSKTAQISLIVPPEAPIIRYKDEDLPNEQNVTVFRLQPVNFECVSRKGKPASTLQWIMKSAVAVQSFTRQNENEPALTDSIIIWNSQRLWSKPGEYLIRCVAHHPGYNQSLITRLTLIVQTNTDTGIMTELVTEIKNVSIMEGAAVHLECIIYGIASRCVWNRSGHIIQIGEDANYKYTDNNPKRNCSLTISRMTRSDANLWSCQIPTPNTTLISKSVQISLIVPPLPPIIRYLNEDLDNGQAIIVNQSQPLLMQCISQKGKPASALDWFVDNNRTDVQSFTQSNTEDQSLQDVILIWNIRGGLFPGEFQVHCVSNHSGYSRPLTAVANIIVKHRFIPTERVGKAVGIEGSIMDVVNISVVSAVIVMAILGAVSVVCIQRLRKNMRNNATSNKGNILKEVKTVSFPTYLVVLPDTSTRISDRPPMPLPRELNEWENGENNYSDDKYHWLSIYDTIDELRNEVEETSCSQYIPTDNSEMYTDN